jgi:hypothetical protein
MIEMSILKKQINDNFSMIPNAIFESKLPHTAICIYCLLHSKPDNWTINNKNIMATLGIASDSTIAKNWKRLIEAGWVSREKVRDENGNLKGGSFVYTINNSPETTHFGGTAKLHILRNSIFCGSPSFGGHSNTELKNKTELNNKSSSKVKNMDKKASLEDRKLEFEKVALEKCSPSKDEKDNFSKFLLYWGEHNDGGKKMKFETMKIFNVKQRWATWKSKSWNDSKTASKSKYEGTQKYTGFDDEYYASDDTPGITNNCEWML